MNKCLIRKIKHFHFFSGSQSLLTLRTAADSKLKVRTCTEKLMGFLLNTGELLL